MVKMKTLEDYISSGRHEFVAFVRNMMSLSYFSRFNHGTWGNDLGKIHFGVLVCDRKSESKRLEENDRVKFFYKKQPMYDKDSDITFGDFSYSAKVISEVPLSLEIHSFYSMYNLKKSSKEFREAKELLKKYGLF